MSTLEIRDLSVNIQGKQVLRGCNFSVPDGEIHALMGSNGAGKSTLVKAIAGHADCTIAGGQIIFDGTDITATAPELRARMGIFLGYQSPVDIPGVSLSNFLRAALHAQGHAPSTSEFYSQLYESLDLVGLDRSFSSRAVNVGFSGGEKKRCEALQMIMLRPKFVLLDEIDSGLDVNAIQRIARCIQSMRANGLSGIVISHYERFLEAISPERVHVMEAGNVSGAGDVQHLGKLKFAGA